MSEISKITNGKTDLFEELSESIKTADIVNFKYASANSVDVERSFSLHKNMLSDCRSPNVFQIWKCIQNNCYTGYFWYLKYLTTIKFNIHLYVFGNEVIWKTFTKQSNNYFEFILTHFFCKYFRKIDKFNIHWKERRIYFELI